MELIEKTEDKNLYKVLAEHWCYEFPYGESCKHCSIELKICEPISKILDAYYQSSEGSPSSSSKETDQG